MIKGGLVGGASSTKERASGSRNKKKEAMGQGEWVCVALTAIETQHLSEGQHHGAKQKSDSKY
jgi:hypothetical protein